MPLKQTAISTSVNEYHSSYLHNGITPSTFYPMIDSCTHKGHMSPISVMVTYLICQVINCRNFLLLGSNGSVKVLVLLEQCLNTVTRSIDAILQWSLTSCHPCLSLFTVTVEQLQLQTLIKLFTASNPCPVTQHLRWRDMLQQCIVTGVMWIRSTLMALNYLMCAWLRKKSSILSLDWNDLRVLAVSVFADSLPQTYRVPTYKEHIDCIHYNH